MTVRKIRNPELAVAESLNERFGLYVTVVAKIDGDVGAAWNFFGAESSGGTHTLRT